MAANVTQPTSPDVPITIKIAFNGSNRKFKLPLRDLGISVFMSKVNAVLQVPEDRNLVLERYSDSNGDYVTLDPRVPTTYKQLYRAAKAKQKLRFRASLRQVGPLGNGDVDAVPQLPPKPTALPPSFSDLSTPFPPIHLERAPHAPVPMGSPLATQSWQVCCNNCDVVMSGVHFHCSICDNGDFDLCETCVGAGVLCNGEGHWLLKRFIQDGVVVNSTTERIAPKPRPTPAQPATSRDAAPSLKKVEKKKKEQPEDVKRTCNTCVRILPESIMITCVDCKDYDLCMACHIDNVHGHHPSHTFRPITKGLPMSPFASALCKSGRNVRHNAICDKCDRNIYGVRHKCLDCPDFDFCQDCVEAGRKTHRHRFVKVFEPLESPASAGVRHFGVYCDGPVCNADKSARPKAYIHGVRYKCAVCDDTDFCANCEAHPANSHNKTHPLIKFKTMVRGVSVTTEATDDASGRHSVLGDKRDMSQPQQTPSTETLPQYSASPKAAPPAHFVPAAATAAVAAAAPKPAEAPCAELHAHFVRDSIPDGTAMSPKTVFHQEWLMQNPGPRAWPAGCNVRLVGGDLMLNLNENRAVSADELAEARESQSLTEDVPPGGMASFSVDLKAPTRLGRYISFWRLKAPDGTPFGHKLWCDIEVADEPVVALQYGRTEFQLASRPKEEAASAKENVKGESTTTPNAETMSGSTMVFPKLDKESPMSSMHQDAAPESDAAKAPSVAATETETASTGAGQEKDVESVQFSDSEDEDGFFTDEEYDILDADDEDMLSNGAAAS